MEFITRCRKCGKRMKSERVDDYRVKLSCICGFSEFKNIPSASRAINPYYQKGAFSHIKIDEKGGLIFEMEKADRERREIITLEEISMLASSDYELEEVLKTVVKKTAQRLKVDVCSIYLREGNSLILMATYGLDQKATGKIKLKIGEGITGSAAKDGRPIFLKNASDDPRYRYFPNIGEEKYTTMLSYPILHEKKVSGVLNVQTITPKDFQEDEIYFISVIANLILGAIKIRKRI